MKKFGRLLTAMVTPFSAKGQVDYTQAKKLARALLESGSDGLVVSGTTGESPTLAFEEKLRLFAEIRTVAGKKATIVAGTGNYNTRESIELTREAEKIGVDACLLTVPYYNKPNQDGLYQHFKAIADSTRLPCIVYNVPSRTITNLAADTTIKLSKIDNIVGIKEASADFGQIARIIDGAGSDFMVYSGNDADTFPILNLGGYGVIGVITHLVGIQYKRMMDLFLTGKIKESAGLHRSFIPLVNTMFMIGSPMPIKYALNHLGFRVGKPRLPLVVPDEKTRAAIEQTLKGYKIDLPIK
ncbi:MAG: 4-hydroxy-tetrahydrodipicolinate synthase [Dehalococcoidia bacterium]|nr:4-hydroxy-tetrahydrodipicolinate synthase [Dehalococcoidia bacterium]